MQPIENRIGLRLSRLLVALMAVLLLGAAWGRSNTALAAVPDELNAAQELTGDDAEGQMGEADIAAQTFQVTKSGRISRIGLYAYAANAGDSSVVTITVRQGIPGAGGATLGTASTTVSGTTPTWYDFDFATPIAVSGSTTYHYEIDVVDTSIGVIRFGYKITSPGSSPYASGDHWVWDTTPPNPPHWVMWDDADLAFRVYLALNQNPTLATNAGLSLNEGATATVANTNLNITDPDNDTITYTVGTAPARGTLKNGASTLGSGSTFTQADINGGQITYTHNGSETTTDSFTFAASDGRGGDIASTTFNMTISLVNDAPTFTLGSDVTVLEDAAAYSATGFLTGASAVEAGQTLSTAVSNNNNALFSVQPTIDGAGKLTFTPAANAHGTAQVTVTMQDNGGTANGGQDTTSKNFSITVTAVNDAPSFTAGANQAVNEDAGAQTVSNWATAISAGPNEATQTVSFTVTNDNNGLFSVQPAVNATGTLTYTPAPNAFGTAQVTVRAQDSGDTANGGSNQSAPQVFTITVNSVNDAPTFTLGSDVTVLEDAAAYSAANFLTGASAVEAGQTLTTSVSNDNNGLFLAQPALNGAGTLTFTPAPDASGTAQVTVTLQDNGGTANGGADTTTKTFTITVTAVNDAPTFTLGSDVTVLEDSAAYSAANFLTGASAVEAGQTLTRTVSNDNNGLFTVQPALDGAGALTFTPAPNAHGTAVVTVTLQDNGGTASGGADTTTKTFSITLTPVNDAPSFTAGADQTVDEDAAAQSVANWATVISAGPNEAAQTASFTVTNDNNGLFSAQPAVSNTGTLTYTPAPNAFGTAQVTVTLQDNGGTANAGVDATTQTFTITVDPINDAPAFTLGSNVTVSEDAAAYSAANFLTGRSAVEAGQTLTQTVSNDNNGLFTAQPALNGAGTLTFTPAPNAFGTAQVTVTLQDDGGTANGGADTTTKTFTITVNAVNDAPTFTLGSDVTVLEDSAAYSATNFLTGASAVEAGQTLTQSVSNDNNGLFSAQPALNGPGTLTFTPAPNAYGTAQVTVTVQDNGGTASGGIDTTTKTFSIIITPINDAPVFTLGSNVTVLEDAAAYSAANFLTGASAVEAGQTLTTSISNDNNGLFSAQPALNGAGTLTFTPAPDASGTAQVTVTLQDNGGTANGGADTTTKTFTITVTAVNDAPTFTLGSDVTVLEDSAAYSAANFLTGASAVEAGQTLTRTVSNNNNGLFTAQPALDGAGTLTFTPALNAHGTAVVTVTVQDNGGTASGGADTTAKTFSITLTPVNDAPSFTAGADQTVDEDAAAQTVANWATVISAGPNEAAQTVSFAVTNDNNGLFSAQPAVSSTGTLTYTPAPNAFGTAQVTVTLQDDGDTLHGGSKTSAPHIFTITVNPVNDAPVFTLGSDVTVLEDSAAYSAANFLTGVGAVEAGQTLTQTVSNDNNGLFSTQPALNGAGTLTFTPAPNAFGTAQVTVTLQDDGGTANGGADTTSKKFTITVTPVNDAPTFTLGSDVTVLEDSAAYSAANFLTAPSAVEAGQTLTQTVSNTNNGLFAAQPALDGAGMLTFTPAPNAYGTALVTVTLQDNGGTTDDGVDTTTKSFTITITPVNDAPTFTLGSDVTVLEDSAAYAAANFLTGADAVEAGQTLTTSISNDNNALFTAQPALDGAGTLTFTPAANAYGAAQVTVTLQDNGGTANGGADTTTKTFTITITAVNDAPVAEDKVLSVIVGNSLMSTVSATDVEGSPLTYALVGAPTKGIISMTADGAFTYQGTMIGIDKFTFKANDGTADSNVATVTVTVTQVPFVPTLTISVPVTETRESSIVVSGTANPGYFVAVAGTTVLADAQGKWSTSVALVEGPNTITASLAGLSRSVTVVRDTTPPLIELTTPDTRTDKESAVLTATSEEGARITIEGQEVSTLLVPLKMGQNRFTATATDRAGNEASVTISVIRVGHDPKPVEVPVEEGQPGEASMQYFHVTIPGETAAEPLLLKVLSPTANTASVELVDDAAEIIGTGDAEASTRADGRPLSEVTATVRFTFDPATVTDPGNLRIYYFDTKHKVWVEVGGTLDTQANTLTVRVEHFTTFAALVPQDEAPILDVPPTEVDTESLTVTGVFTPQTPVSLVINGESQRTAMTDKSGRFTLKGTLAEGRNWVYVKGTGVLASREYAVIYQNGPIYTDIGGHWAEATINRLAKLRIITVYPQPLFKPEAQVTRLEFAVMVARVLGLTPVTEAPTFTDTESMPEWSWPEVAAAYRAGIIKGMPDGSFAPHKPITRAEMAIMLTRALGYAGKDITPGNDRFADGAEIPDWAQDQVYTAARYGLITGYPDGTFQPLNSTTRAEAVTMLARLLDEVNK